MLLFNTQMRTIFVILNLLKLKKEITEKEWDLIDSIRNYHKAFPNGTDEIEYYIYKTLEELLDRI